LAQLLTEIQETARREAVPFPDYGQEILGEYQAALDANPDDLALHRALAQFYRQQADARPDLRLNYLLLAAQELETVLLESPNDQELSAALSQTYYDIATAASRTGDPEGALVYLRKAEDTPGKQDEEMANATDLVLRWAVSLADQGQVAKALAEVSDLISPGIQDALARYAPPVISMRGQVELSPSARTVRYQFFPYLPSEDLTLSRLQEIATKLNAIIGCQVGLSTNQDSLSLEIVVPFETLTSLSTQAATIVDALSQDPDLLDILVATPWQSEVQEYQTQSNGMRDIYLYRELLHTRALQDASESDSEYVRWRIIELQESTPEDERQQLEKNLSLIALQEQLQIWQQLPSSSYWTYQVRFDAENSMGSTWRVSLGQERDLIVERTVYHWPVIVRRGLSALGILILVIATSILLRQRRSSSLKA
jgi:hypothetical protein